ncbi:unnamed protein product [Darwinula stevensoni]|uniref:Coiled-coil domain-containing protein 137 n=1 Tax=Darwinula stevensoni TaxID=69355 RepID=A0A7R9A9B8_9CRUS|nr:unnamed protein product [Darwinula stevensoni]CAG0897251.1 unnamed protein product [Darwinula stevensoni]
MGKIGKPQKKRHHKVRNPLEVAAAKERWKEQRMKKPKKPNEEQEIPRSIRDVMQFMESTNGGQSLPKKHRRKRKGSKLLDSQKLQWEEEPWQRGMNKPLKPIPIYKQMKGESNHKFLNRIHKTTKVILNQAHFETKYNVDIYADPQTGLVSVKKGKRNPQEEIEAEIQTLAKEEPKILKFIEDRKGTRGNEKKQKQQKDFSASGEPQNGARGQKRKLRCQELKGRKKRKKLQKELESHAEFQCDPVEFGEVAPAPPSLPVLPRKAQLNDSRPGKRGLLLKSLFEGAAEKKSKKVGQPSLAKQRILEDERLRVMAAYQDLKLRRKFGKTENL